MSPEEKHRVPVWVCRDEAVRIIELLPPPWNEIASLLYGSGLRISEALQLRCKDLDSQTTEIYLHCLPSLASRVSSPLDNVISFRKAG